MSHAQTKAARILIVGTPPEDLVTARTFLTSKGYEVESAPDLPTALATIQDSSPDLILLDGSLITPDGYEPCAHLIAPGVGGPIPVLVAGPEDPAQAYAAGALDYVSKPFNPEEVLARVQTHLAVRALRAELQDQGARLAREADLRQSAETALQESERLGRALLENLSEVIYTADETGTLTYISPSIERFTGHRPSEVIGRHFSEFIHPEDVAHSQAVFRHVAAGQNAANEYRVVTRSGEVRWMRTSSQPVVEGGSLVGVQGILTDITDHVQAEAHIREQNEFLTGVLESLTHPFYVIDANKYTVEIANSAAGAGALTGQTTCYALTHGLKSACDTAEHPCPLEEIKKTGQPVTVEHTHRDPAGRVRHVEVHGYPLFDAEGNVARVIEYALDITERKQVETALRQSEQRHRQLLDALQEGIWVIDQDACTTFVNPRMAQMLGYTVEEMVGRSLFDFMDERGAEITRRNLERRRQGIREQHDFEFRHRDGHRLYALLETSPIYDERGNYVGGIAGIQDITERRRVEEALREAKEAAETARHDEAERRQEAERRRQIAESLADVLAALNSNQPLDNILDRIAAEAMRLLGSQAIAIYRLEGQEGALALQAARGLPTNAIDCAGQPTGAAVVQQAVAARRPVAVPHRVGDLDGGLHPAGQESTPAQWSEQCRALLAVPIEIEDQVYGGMLVHYPDPQTFASDAIDLAGMFADQVALAVENARLREEVRQAATSAERNRLARDLHDSVTQALFSASLVAEVLPQVWRRDPSEALEGLEELRLLTRAALSEMRTLLLELRPSAVAQTGLNDLLRQLAEATTSRARLAVTLDLEPVPLLPSEVHVTFYRVAQEALNNVTKHAQAGGVVVTLRASPPVTAGQAAGWQGQVILHVRDDGRGFTAGETRSDHWGLSIMRERAQAVGAMLSIHSAPGQGSQVTLVWQCGQPLHTGSPVPATARRKATKEEQR